MQGERGRAIQGTVPDEEFRPLTDSLTSCIRWRLTDYEVLLKAEVALVLSICQRQCAAKGRARTQ